MSSNAFTYQLSELGKTILPKGSHLWLYGSRARGDYHNESDWDLLILLDKEKQELSDFDNYSYPFIYNGALADQVVSAHIYTNKEWEKMSFMPFYKNVEQDKIVLVGALQQKNALSTTFSRLQTMRERGDYNCLIDTTKEEILPFVDKVNTFINKIESLIKS